jgi:hypothetical protein
VNIALDYDETYTADKVMWGSFIGSAQARGHKVTFVTFRPDYRPDLSGYNGDIREDAKTLGIDIVFTEGEQKSACFDADIWIFRPTHRLVTCGNSQPNDLNSDRSRYRPDLPA